ncbi:hypothetical protein [Maribacter sp.]|uniref:hypothetical protein n=1 Tax=Maribacter sp. TaxID=1897614 RepID=UPI0025B914D3|nr:hypothetical protein [Maribacter sp.]
MKRVLSFIMLSTLVSCGDLETSKIENIKKKTEIKKEDKYIKMIKSSISLKKDYEVSKIVFDKTKVSKYTVEESEIDLAKTIIKPLSSYSTKQLLELPESKRLRCHVVVPSTISKESLRNTLKSILFKKTEKDKNIDVVEIFAYDNKKDIGNGYTYGKILWSPEGGIGKVTSKIAIMNIRDNYKTEVNIKAIVGNLKINEMPTEKELNIYYEIMSEKYYDMQEEEFLPAIMRKYNIKTEKELNDIFIKVLATKM